MALGWCHIILKHDLVDWQFVKRWSNASFIVVPDMEPTGYTEAVQNTKSPYEYRTRLLTEADIDPSMVDWEVEGEGNPKRYLVYDQLNHRWTYWQADPEDAHWEGETWTKQTSGFTQDVSRLRDDESKVAGWVADLSEFDPAYRSGAYRRIRSEAQRRQYAYGPSRMGFVGGVPAAGLLPSGCRR